MEPPLAGPGPTPACCLPLLPHTVAATHSTLQASLFMGPSSCIKKNCPSSCYAHLVGSFRRRHPPRSVPGSVTRADKKATESRALSPPADIYRDSTLSNNLLCLRLRNSGLPWTRGYFQFSRTSAAPPPSTLHHQPSSSSSTQFCESFASLALSPYPFGSVCFGGGEGRREGVRVRGGKRERRFPRDVHEALVQCFPRVGSVGEPQGVIGWDPGGGGGGGGVSVK